MDIEAHLEALETLGVPEAVGMTGVPHDFSGELPGSELHPIPLSVVLVLASSS